MRGWPIPFLVGALLCCGSAIACKNDTQCLLTDKCVFAKGIEEGDCMHVVAPVEVPTDQEQLKRSWREKGDTGYPCQFNTDCLPGKACFKEEFKSQGYCKTRSRSMD
jgi:hypothetical protein